MTSLRYRASDPDFFRRFCRHQLVVIPVVWLLSFVVNRQMIRPTEPIDTISDVTVTLVQHNASGVAVLPQGWRRTANGWEHTADWQNEGIIGIDPDRSMRAHLAAEKTREISLAEKAVQKVRETSPVAIAFCQILMIGGIWFLCPKRKSRKIDQEDDRALDGNVKTSDE